MRRNYEIEVIQVLLSVAIVALTVILFFRSDELTILFPITFGLTTVLAAIYALEGLLFNRNRVTKRSRIVVFGLITVLMGLITYISARTVLS